MSVVCPLHHIVDITPNLTRKSSNEMLKSDLGLTFKLVLEKMSGLDDQRSVVVFSRRSLVSRGARVIPG